nr:unnamed protein product [Spirometra erinaceieuropaei]
MVSTTPMTMACSSYKRVQYILLPPNAREVHLDAPSVATLEPAGPYPRSGGRDQRDVQVTKAISGVDGCTDNRLVISKMGIRPQPQRMPQGGRPPAAPRDAEGLDDSQAEKIQGYADRYEWKDFFSAIKAVYGSPNKAIASLISADGSTLLTEKAQILQRWIEHFRDVLNRPSTISDAAIARLPQVEINVDLDLPFSLHENIRAVRQPPVGKRPDRTRSLLRFTSTMVRQLCDGMMARVTENGTVSEAFAVTNGVKRGYVLAPTLFSLMFAAMLMDTCRDERPRTRVAYRTDGQLLNHRRMHFQSRISATSVHDDCAVKATPEGDMQRSMGIFAAA